MKILLFLALLGVIQNVIAAVEVNCDQSAIQGYLQAADTGGVDCVGSNVCSCCVSLLSNEDTADDDYNYCYAGYALIQCSHSDAESIKEVCPQLEHVTVLNCVPAAPPTTAAVEVNCDQSAIQGYLQAADTGVDCVGSHVCSCCVSLLSNEDTADDDCNLCYAAYALIQCSHPDAEGIKEDCPQLEYVTVSQGCATTTSPPTTAAGEVKCDQSSIQGYGQAGDTCVDCVGSGSDVCSCCVSLLEKEDTADDDYNCCYGAYALVQCSHPDGEGAKEDCPQLQNLVIGKSGAASATAAISTIAVAVIVAVTAAGNQIFL